MGDVRTRIDIDAIKRAVSIVEAVAAFCPSTVLRRQGTGLVGLSPFKAERTPSFTVDPRRGVFYCFATQQGGDAITLVMLVVGVDFVTAAQTIADRCMNGVPMVSADPDDVRRRTADRERQMADLAAKELAEQAGRIRAAETIWRYSVDGEISPVAAYLAARGVDLAAMARIYGRRVPASIRFHASLRNGRGDGMHVGPAMVGHIVDRHGNMTGVHRTWLSYDGTGKAALPKDRIKLTLGRVWGSFGVLTPLDCSDHAVVGEGYETTLTVIAALARRGERVVGLSALSLGNLAGGAMGPGKPHPHMPGRRLPGSVPDPSKPGMIPPIGIKRMTILRDADGRDPAAVDATIERAIAKYRMFVPHVRVATPAAGCDFNDMITRAA